MSNKLDNDLKNRIREVFDNYDDASADAGWQRLREKFPEEEKHRRIIGWWWYAAAAVLLLCLGTWFYYPQTQQQVVSHYKKDLHTVDNNDAIVANKPATQNQSNEKLAADQIAGNSTPTTDQQSDHLSGQLNAGQKTAGVVTGSLASRSAGTRPAGSAVNKSVSTGISASNSSMAFLGTHEHRTVLNRSHTSNHSIVPFNSDNQQMANSNLKNQPNTGNAAFEPNTPNIIANAKTADNSAADTSGGNNAVVSSLKKSAVLAQTPAQISAQKAEQMFAEDKARQALVKNDVKKSLAAAGKKSGMFSVYAGTFFNYAKGSNNKVNVGAGFTSDFKLSGNLKLSTGVSIAQNNVSFDDNNKIPAQLNERAVATANAAIALNNNMQNFAVSGAANVPPSVKNYNASLMGLDIPINLKYEFNPRKSDAYISAGISSGTYINETYSSSYSYYNAYASLTTIKGAVSNINVVQPTQETTSKQHFNSFDFAKTLNFAFGMGYPLGKNRLIIEPFLKYPIDGLGAQDIRFGAGGVNLKLNLNSSKKK